MSALYKILIRNISWYFFKLLSGVLLTQTQLIAGGAGEDSQGAIIELANDILGKIPPLYDIIDVSEKYPVMYTNSMNTVLRQVSMLWLTSALFFPLN